MKQRLFLAALLFGAVNSWGQGTQKGVLLPATSSGILTRSSLPSMEKTLLCVDTLRYPQAKEQILGTNTFYDGFGVWQEDNESVSQAFINSSSLTITGVEFYGARSTSGAATVTVNAAIYNVDASNVPTTLIGSGDVTVTATAYGYRYATFATPVTVTGNYAVVLKPTNAGGIINLYVSDIALGQSYDELFARFFSTYPFYPNPGVWNTIPTFEEDGANYEPLIAPIVNYTINTEYTPSATEVCQGTPVTYTNATTPAAALSNRMLNYQAFRTYFGTAPSDSTYVYDMDNASPLIWNANTTYTHPAAGAYDVVLATNGGFWSSCFDFSMQTITVNAIPAVPTISAGGPTTFCAGGNVVLTSSASTGNTWSNAALTPAVTISASGSYTVTATTNGCTSAASAPVAVTVTPADDATFSYTTYTLCTGGSNPVATATTTGGTYSSTAGLVFASTATGEIDMGTSSQGTYVVTYTTAGACPSSSTHSVTITTAPDADFTFSAGTYCSTESDPLPIFGVGASGGTFSSTTGLVINPGTGAVDLSASTGGSYVITNSIAASGICPAASATQTIVIDESVTPAFTQIAAVCEGGAAPVFPSTSSDGVAGTWSPAFNNTATTAYTFTPDAGECATNATMTVTITPNVTPSFDIAGPFCEGAAIPALAVTSNNGVTGTWAPAINNTETTTYTFTPASGQCATTGTTSIVVNPTITPAFAAIDNLCQGEAAPSLPAASTNGITVTWNPIAISTAIVGTETYTATPVSGQCATTATLTVTVQSCLSVDENTLGDLSVFPNPATGEVTISFSDSANEDVEMRMITGDGKLVLSKVFTASGQLSETIDVSAYADGVYYIQLQTSGGVSTARLIKK